MAVSLEYRDKIEARVVWDRDLYFRSRSEACSFVFRSSDEFARIPDCSSTISAMPLFLYPIIGVPQAADSRRARGQLSMREGKRKRSDALYTVAKRSLLRVWGKTIGFRPLNRALVFESYRPCRKI